MPISARSMIPHLAILFAGILLVQGPRLNQDLARLLYPYFVPAAGYLDFDQGYYPAGQTIRSDPSQLYRGAVYDESHHKLVISAPANFVNIPLVAWLFFPFTLLPLHQAGVWFLLLNIAATLASLFLILRRTSKWKPVYRYGITLAFASSGPLMNALNLGQTTPLILLVLLLAESCLHRGKDVQAGLWLGLACLIKIPPLLFIPYFAIQKRWRLLSATMAVLVIATAVSLMLYGLPLHATYVDVVFRANAGTFIAAHNNQSLDAFLGRLFTHAPLLSWEPVIASGAQRLIHWILFAALLIGSGWAIFQRKETLPYQRMLLELGIVMCVSLLLSPVSWVHYGLWLLPVAAAVAAAAQSRSLQLRFAVLLITAVLLINIPVPSPAFIQRFGNEMWFRVAISHQFMGTLILLMLCVRLVRDPLPENVL